MIPAPNPSTVTIKNFHGLFVIVPSGAHHRIYDVFQRYTLPDFDVYIVARDLAEWLTDNAPDATVAVETTDEKSPRGKFKKRVRITFADDHVATLFKMFWC